MNEFILLTKKATGASSTETVDSGSIPGQVIPKTIKIGIHSFPAWRSAIKGTVWSFRHVW